MSLPERDERAFVFDFGRVLFRWRPEVVVSSALPGRAATAADVQYWVAEIFQSYGGDWQEFDRGSVDVDALATRIASRTGLGRDEVHAVVRACTHELQPLPDSVAWLRRLHAQGRALHFLSNMPEPFARHFERTHDFMALFQSGVFSSRAGLVKPDPAIFAHAAQAYAREPRALLLLDDHLPNVLAARAAGWQAVHFEHAAQAEVEVAALDW